jgi:hypothetical protein
MNFMVLCYRRPRYSGVSQTEGRAGSIARGRREFRQRMEPDVVVATLRELKAA